MGSQGEGARLEELEGSVNVVKAASVAWRLLTHDVERWMCELDWMVDGIRESNYYGARRGRYVTWVQAA